MAGKRKDNKGRTLLPHEYQRYDGRYEYRYTDIRGEEKVIYSWTLLETDRLPEGKEECECLRVQEDQLRRDLNDGIDTGAAKKLTLNDLFEVNIRDRQLKDSTRENYTYMYNHCVRDRIGWMKVGNIKYSDIRHFYMTLITELHYKPCSMEIVNTIIHPIFTQAVRDGYIRMNPTDGVMAEIKRRHDWEKPHRKALTQKEQEVFLRYLSDCPYSEWLPLITVMLGTGCRIGEVLGLCWHNIDYDENTITVDHNLIYRHLDGKCHDLITTPKTKAGVRKIPMFPEVRDALMKEKERQQKAGLVSPEIDGYSDFVFLNRSGGVRRPSCINRMLLNLVNSYNEQECKAAEAEKRSPVLLPRFSAHQLRHTFCTRLCENTSDTNTLKTIQEIMGHADISTTLDVYTDLTMDQKQKAFNELRGKFFIG